MKVKHLTMFALVLTMFSLLSGYLLSSSAILADTEVIDRVELTIPVACTMGGTGAESHIAPISSGTYSGAPGGEYENGIGKTTLTVFCNDSNGFSVYAIGFTEDAYEGENHTKLIGNATKRTIATKVYTSGDTNSSWSVKVNKVENPTSGDPVTYNPENMTVMNSFNSWHTIPDVFTKVAEYRSSTTDPATTDTTLGAKLETTYASYISSTQPADIYSGQVKYTMVHPYTHSTPELPTFRVLYTGRALSNTEGQENPVVIPMSELPAGSTYNLLGTTSGLYDKLTSNTLYGGYFKYTGDIDEFTAEYLNNYAIYNGSNLDWAEFQYQSVDAANIIPEANSVYLVREVPNGFLRAKTSYSYNKTSGTITSFSMYSSLDSGVDDATDDVRSSIYYNNCGFVIDGSNVGGALYNYLTSGSSRITAQSAFGNVGVQSGYIIYRQYNDMLVAGSHTIVPFWITLDRYKVTGTQRNNITFTEVTRDGYSASTSTIPTTITKW
ncbi:hypothetical protein IKF30_01915 [Candidatus Saccharibacteria bacterium]|nr:hypothetical protein [Candidatus Saccharibacteria bacterium]